MERGAKQYGVVVTPTAPHGEEFTNKVFVLQDSGLHRMFVVKREAFTLAPDAIEHLDGNEFDIVADIKNQVRRRERPLEVGDWITWFYSGTDQISEFKREHKLHETRVGNPYYQFKLECVKSPTDICLYNHAFGYISITAEEAHKLLANVAFYAWVDVYVDESGEKDKLVVKFHSYHTTDHQMQIKVLDAPWTEHHRVDQRGLDDDDMQQWLVVKVGEDKSKQNNVYGIFGFYVSERSFYREDTPEKFYILPYVDDALLVAGCQYRFDAFWSESMNHFIVVGYEKMVDMDVLQTEGEASTRILILDSVNQRLDIKSIFSSSKSNFGLMDDPTGALSMHHLSRYAESKCRIYFYEDRDASFGRFRIEKVDVDKAKKIDKNVRDGVTMVKGVKGVVISVEGRVFSAVHSPLRIFLPVGKKYPVGTQIVFNANVDHDTKELAAIDDENMRVLPGSAPIDYFEYNGRLIFKTEAAWTARSDAVYGVVSEQFSLLDDSLRLLPRTSGRAAATVKVWVTESGMDKDGARRVAQTPFFIVAVKSSKPTFTTPCFIDPHARNLSGFVKLRDGTLHKMEAETTKEAQAHIAGRFSRPARAVPLTVPAAPLTVPALVPPCTAPRTIFLPKDADIGPDFVCGCASGKCVAKKVIIDLMNDEAFRKIIPADVLDEVLECLF